MPNLFKILFLNMLIIGSMIAISSYSWMSMWMGLEINLLSIIPLLSDSRNLYPAESAMKYFITQALASAILLFSIVMSLNLEESVPQDSNSNFWLMIILNSAFFIKMGAAPFHAWFPEVIEGLNWNNCFIMLTWQKVAPMILLMYSQNMSLLFSFVIIFSSLIGGILGFNQVSMRKIMAFSSINHIGWMIASMLHSTSVWFIYFSIYSLITLSIVNIFKFYNIFYLKQFINSLNSSKTLKFFFIMNFLSLGGLPPFLGFFPKWLTVNNLIESKFWITTLVLIISTLITLFFYLRIMFSSLVINYSESIISQSNMPLLKKNMVLILNFLSLVGIIICTLLPTTF